MFERIFEYFRVRGGKIDNNPIICVITVIALSITVFALAPMVGHLASGGPLNWGVATILILNAGVIFTVLYPAVRSGIAWVTFNQYEMPKYKFTELCDFAVGYFVTTVLALAIPSIIISSIVYAWLPLLWISVVGGVTVGLAFVIRKAFELRVRLDQHEKNQNAHSDSKE